LYPKQAFTAQILLAGLIGYHALFFYHAASTWKAAGSIARQTFYLADKLPAPKPIHFKNLPGTVSGIPVFRLGLEEGLDWLVSPKSSEKITIKSRQDFNEVTLSISNQETDTCYVINFMAAKP
jgi:hypothetical protein